MAYEPGGSDRREELVAVIRRVRNRWRLKLALRGAVIVVAGTFLALLLSASSLEALRFSPTAIIAFRVIALVVFAGLVLIGFVQPLRRRVSDGQVALYLEEKDPTLETAILSAIESMPAADGSGPRAVADAGRAARRTGDREVPRPRRRRGDRAGEPPAAAVCARRHRRRRDAPHRVGPAFLRSGMSALLIISRSAEAASPYKIDVTPGNAKIPRGADQNVTGEASRLLLPPKRR